MPTGAAVGVSTVIVLLSLPSPSAFASQGNRLLSQSRAGSVPAICHQSTSAVQHALSGAAPARSSSTQADVTFKRQHITGKGTSCVFGGYPARYFVLLDYVTWAKPVPASLSILKRDTSVFKNYKDLKYGGFRGLGTKAFYASFTWPTRTASAGACAVAGSGPCYFREIEAFKGNKGVGVLVIARRRVPLPKLAAITKLAMAKFF